MFDYIYIKTGKTKILSRHDKFIRYYYKILFVKNQILIKIKLRYF